MTLEHITSKHGIDKLLAVVAKLRDPDGGCPWDLEQTHATLKQYLIEETYEVIEAIDHEPHKLREELGDVLLQVVLHSQIASEAGSFDFNNVTEAISVKLIKRHPHVFGDTAVKDSSQVLENWERIKQKELSGNQSILDGVPRSMPALLRAQRTSEKAARVGFDWEHIAAVREKIAEEIQEFVAALESGPQSVEAKLEFGDLLFSLVQLGRKLEYDCEDLLHLATTKFTQRFKRMEQRAPRPLKDLTVKELDDLWEQVKRELASEAVSG